MKITTQMWIAFGAVFLVLLITIGPVLAGGASYPVPITEQRVAPASILVIVPAARATEPLQAEQSGPPQSNPFTLRQGQTGHQVLPIPAPPPPPLELPLPPALPVVEK
ncbi:MAG: hypothetical protein H0X38_05320 [Planctomycetes bacterium]|nr:hypothetical protein [Planctomycetota bacterium]